jgi:choline dehydrogenase
MKSYFQKAETFTPPIAEYREQGNVTWDDSVHGFRGPISATWPAQFYPSAHSAWAAEKALGIPHVEDQAGGAPFGSLWYPSSERPAKGKYVRSYSKNEYFDPIRGQDNIHFLANTTVTRILFHGTRAVGVEVREKLTWPALVFLEISRRGLG